MKHKTLTISLHKSIDFEKKKKARLDSFAADGIFWLKINLKRGKISC